MSRLNGTVVVNTTGIRTTVNCVNPANMALQNNTNGTLSLTSTSVEQCVHTVVFDPNVNFPVLFLVHDIEDFVSGRQYPIRCRRYSLPRKCFVDRCIFPSCDVLVWPCCSLSPNNVLTSACWRYFHQKSDNTSQAQTVFCTPSIELFDVQASAILNNGSLINVVALSNNPTTNSLNTQTYNGSVSCLVLIQLL